MKSLVNNKLIYVILFSSFLSCLDAVAQVRAVDNKGNSVRI